MNFTEKQLERYSRQMILPHFGGLGQEKLLNSSVLVCGAGGLGSSVIMHLAAAGIGNIGIIDCDKVEMSNLHRQIIHSTDDVGRLKTDSAKDKVNNINSDVKVDLYSERLTNANAEKIFFKYDIIVDGLDNFTDKFLINDTCINLNKKFVHAGVVGFEGQVLTVNPSDSVTLRDLFPDGIPEELQKSCKDIGVLNTCVGVISTIQANEVLKLILNIGSPLYNKILKFNSLESSFKELVLRAI